MKKFGVMVAVAVAAALGSPAGASAQYPVVNQVQSVPGSTGGYSVPSYPVAQSGYQSCYQPCYQPCYRSCYQPCYRSYQPAYSVTYYTAPRSVYYYAPSSCSVVYRTHYHCCR